MKNKKQKFLNIGAHGLGDCMLSLQVSRVLTNHGISHQNLISTRGEVFNPLNFIFSDFNLERISEDYSENNALLHNSNLVEEIKNKYDAEYITYNIPQLLFQNPMALKCDLIGTSPFLIKKIRLLTDKFLLKENIIYCALTSSANKYIRNDLKEIITKVAEKVPNYTVYFPYLKKWVETITYNFDQKDSFPPNVVIDDNPPFINSLDVLVKSKYCLTVDNGPSHIAYHLGIPRLLLDQEFARVAHLIRWKQDYEECVPFNLSPEEISSVVYNNIYYPFTTGMDRKIMLQLIRANQTNWNQIFGITF
jgi:hypothetical protein